MDPVLAQLLRRKCAEAIQGQKDTVSSGVLPTFEKVQYHCGIRKGLEDALVLLDEALDEMRKNS